MNYGLTTKRFLQEPTNWNEQQSKAETEKSIKEKSAKPIRQRTNTGSSKEIFDTFLFFSNNKCHIDNGSANESIKHGEQKGNHLRMSMRIFFFLRRTEIAKSD